MAAQRCLPSTWGGVADENTRFCKVYLIDLSYVKL
jgi:hypothetical protein